MASRLFLSAYAEYNKGFFDALASELAQTICNDLHFVGSWIYLYTTNWLNNKW